VVCCGTLTSWLSSALTLVVATSHTNPFPSVPPLTSTTPFPPPAPANRSTRTSASTLSPSACPCNVATTSPFGKLTSFTPPFAPPTAAIWPLGATAKDVIPCVAGSSSGELGGQKMDALKTGVEEEISHKMREESREVVRSWRPRGGGNRPAVQARVCEERTVRVFPDGTADRHYEGMTQTRDLHCQSQTEESSHPDARTFPFGCQVSHYN